MIWADSPWHEACARQWREGRCFRLQAVYGEHGRFGPQVEIHQIREVVASDGNDGFDPADLVAHSRFDPPAMLADLMALVQDGIGDLPLRCLVQRLLERHQAAFLRLPATPRHFYPFAGGLLEHTLSVARTCLHLADYYAQRYPNLRPPLNRDLIVAGAILHDIGRVAELDDNLAAVHPTVDGRLFGHLLLGRDLIREAARGVEGLDADLLRRLEHIVVAHLALPAWGSLRLPLIPECLVIHHADDLDAKMEMYVRCLTAEADEGDFTARDPILGRRLYRPRER
jgi:3'-5' exoribonuclease